jgi:hypothetical protein
MKASKRLSRKNIGKGVLLGDDPRTVFAQLRQIQLVEVVLPARVGVAQASCFSDADCSYPRVWKTTRLQ